jgi:glucokinase
MTLGIDLGGTSLRVGLFDESLTLVTSKSLPTRVASGPEAVVADMVGMIDDVLDHMELDRRAIRNSAKVGLGSPGPLDLRTGTMGTLPNFPGWDNFPIRESLARAAGLPVYLDCDANAAAVAEWKFGAGREARLDTLAMITLGTGVGSGIVLRGQVWHGMVGMGGEVGHISVDRHGPVCGCGGRGCLEMYASANGLLRLAREAGERGGATESLRALTQRPEGFTAKEVAHLAETGDRSAAEVFANLGWWLGFGLSPLINILDLPLVIIGGGVADAWRLFAPSMFDALREYSNVYRLAEPGQREALEENRTFVRAAVLGPAAGLLGAALLPHLDSQQREAPQGALP